MHSYNIEVWVNGDSSKATVVTVDARNRTQAASRAKALLKDVAGDHEIAWVNMIG